MKKKRFKFRLERVLSHREGLKKEKERELAERNRELHEAEETLERLATAHDSISPPGSGEPIVTTMAELTQVCDWQRYLQEALVQQKLSVDEAHRAVEDAREAYIEKAVDAKTLETLRDKKHEQFRDERTKDEKKELDKQTVLRFRLTKNSLG